MTDRELLELAAKAAGYRVHGWINDKLYVINGPNPAEYYDPFSWNPLSDDGDALRLAVKLNIRIEPNFSDGSHFIFAGIDNPNHAPELIWESEYEWLAEEISQEDPMGATRRAIVRAAVEIGKRRA
ncbi:hypothetical protein [Burkholderia vietnamiensis]|uniref:hypothetical protein n=1 Tax=Burkholderia vietnamiensis TaxID=60552 RepID=UPI001B910A2B|nr:hypothetical protein [Burkholderia vietnamiensis]MBR8007179.1 hypothetical protein [Burkholderia vietnamiensis]